MAGRPFLSLESLSYITLWECWVLLVLPAVCSLIHRETPEEDLLSSHAVSNDKYLVMYAGNPISSLRGDLSKLEYPIKLFAESNRLRREGRGGSVANHP